jgi:hypothetical protein
MVKMLHECDEYALAMKPDHFDKNVLILIWGQLKKSIEKTSKFVQICNSELIWKKTKLDLSMTSLQVNRKYPAICGIFLPIWT